MLLQMPSPIEEPLPVLLVRPYGKSTGDAIQMGTRSRQ